MIGAAISVVIPSYNGAAYIRGAMESVLRQTVLPQEIIVADDSSRDGTVATVEDVARTAAVPLRILRLRRNSGGPAHPINVGVQAATSELIAVVEQDDRMMPTRISRSLDAAKAFPSAGLICGRVRMKSPAGRYRDDLWKDGRQQFDDLTLTRIGDGLYRADSEDVLRCLLRRNIVFGNSNVVFPRSVWKRVGGFDRKYRICTDLDFNLKVARVAPFAVIDEVLGEYYQRPDGLYNSNVDVDGKGPAQFEAAFIRMRHALQSYDPNTAGAKEWYWGACQMLKSELRRRDWKRCCSILGTLCSSGALQNRVTAKLRRMVACA